jgi:hypothetical protein
VGGGRSQQQEQHIPFPAASELRHRVFGFALAVAATHDSANLLKT